MLVSVESEHESHSRAIAVKEASRRRLSLSYVVGPSLVRAAWLWLGYSVPRAR